MRTLNRLDQGKKSACFVLVLLLVLSGGFALGGTEPSDAQLATVLESLLVDEDETAVLFDWSRSGTATDPVDWETDGIQEAPKWMHHHGAYQREGRVVAGVDETRVPGDWVVTLLGPREGFDVVLLQLLRNHPAECAIMIPSKLSNGLTLEPYRCTNEPATVGAPVYTVTMKGRRNAWLIHEYSAGSGGCNESLELVFDQARADAVQCWGEPE